MAAPDLASLLSARESGRAQKVALRMSSLGKCARALSHGIAGTPTDEQYTSRTERVFGIGDIVESRLVAEIHEVIPAGWNLRDTGEHQRAVSLVVEVEGVGPITLYGHPDGTIVSPSGRQAILEVKSTNTYAFSKWQQAPWDPSESYWWQHQAYLHAAGVGAGYVLGLCKESGALVGWWTIRDEGAVALIAAHLAEAHKPPTEAARVLPDGTPVAPAIDRHKTHGRPNKGHGVLPWHCGYCPYAKTCWAENGLSESWETDWRKRPKRVLRVERTEEWEAPSIREAEPSEAHEHTEAHGDVDRADAFDAGVAR